MGVLWRALWVLELARNLLESLKRAHMCPYGVFMHVLVCAVCVRCVRVQLSRAIKTKAETIAVRDLENILHGERHMHTHQGVLNQTHTTHTKSITRRKITHEHAHSGGVHVKCLAYVTHG